MLNPNTNHMKRMIYTAPQTAALDIRVEKGFALTGTGIEDWKNDEF